MNQRLRICFITGFICMNIASFAQSSHHLVERLEQSMDVYAQRQNETSVYLRCNKDVYIAGEDLWFSSFVLNAQHLLLSGLDSILYLQLVHEENDSVIWKEMYPINQGVASGHVFLPHTLEEGTYLLKAYTAHSYYAAQPYFYAFTPVQVVKDPRAIKRYWHLAQSISPGKGEPVRFDIFPEGGSLVAGLPGVVGFRAVNKDGLPVNISGVLLKNDQPLLDIQTAHAGMGSFRFQPEAGAEYTVKLNNVKDSLYRIPVNSGAGVTMHLQNNDRDSLVFKVAAVQMQPKRVALRLQVRGVLQFIVAGLLRDSLIIKIPTTGIPPGVAEATLFDEQLRPLADRLLFLHQDNRLNIQVSQLKEWYGPLEKVSLKIRTTDGQGHPVPAVLSLRIVDGLFIDRRNVQDITNYFQLSTQLEDSIYDPAYYFDTANKDRRSALDAMLMTREKERYNWSGHSMSRDTLKHRYVLSDSIKGTLSPIGRPQKDKQPLMLMLFNHNKSLVRFTGADKNGVFYITPEQLHTGRRFFIKYFAESEYNMQVTDPFDAIKAVEREVRPVHLSGEKSIVVDTAPLDTSRLQYGNMLREVVVQAAGRGYGDRYFGYLDSIAKFEGNTDYVGQCGWLNCPACGSGKKPVEGVTYSELVESKRSQVSSHPFSFTAADMRKVTYHYPKYTEEELLKKFKMIMVKGFYEDRVFSGPDYDKADRSVADTRNTLYWNPVIITDGNGEASVSFFTSGIRSAFTGIAEGVSGNGSLGTATFGFSVR
ncbi:hypothetical protein [Chitinophaga japonensis]|uniref:MG2 domain-containing protein n=1 Tax=Chitinophaga japonensis TaxID=104662 RepID=A0A562T5L0_CHIJA|nr:hypothetical protein [Chitinophaga japonensis]TWI88815.1 hypothetical protein LX66_2901 [Chitinophaga japonensis]